jgi:PAS domain-containing protein
LASPVGKFGKEKDVVMSGFGEAQITPTELQPTSEMLRAAEEEFRVVFELSAVGITVADPLTGRFVRVNRKFCEITGYRTEELLQMNFGDVTHPDDRERDRMNFQSVLDGGQDH